MKRTGLRLFLPAVCLIFFNSAVAQKNKPVIDSLVQLTAIQTDSLLVQTYNELTWQYRLVDREKAIAAGNKAIQLAKRIDYKKGIAQAYNDLGIIFFDKENYDTAIALYNRSAELRQQLNDELGQAKIFNKIGIVYQKQGSFDKALDNQLKALALFERAANDQGISYSLNNIGILHQNLGRYEKAIEYQLRSIAIKEKINDRFGLAGSYVNIANNYLNLNDPGRSADYYNRAIAISRELGDKEYLSNALNNLGSLHLKAGKPKQAMPLIHEAYRLRDTLGDTKGMVSCLHNLGDAFVQLEQYDSAAQTLERGLSMGRNAVNCKPEINKIYFTLAELYERKGDSKKALELFKLYAATKDSLFTDGLSGKFAELETKFKTLEKENLIQQQQFDLTRKNYWIISITGLLLLGSLLAYSFFHRNKLKQQKSLQREIIEQQELATKAILHAEENERKRIAADLHDGVGQMMSVAKMNLSAFETDLQFTSAQQKTAYQKMIDLVDDSCKEIRSISHQMMPNALLKSGLASALKEFLDRIDARILRINFHAEGLDRRLPTDVETVLYRVLQECVNNVIKHAAAESLEISLIKDSDGIAVTIEDNGKGFDRTTGEFEEGIGLKNIRTRVGYLKGTVEFHSQPGRGTLVAIHVPVST